MNIKITKISAEETWSLRHKVMWPEKPLEYIKLPNDNNGLHYGLWKDKKIVSTISLFITNEKAQFRKLATEIAEQGNGYGTQLLMHIMTLMPNYNVHKIWCNARIDKTSFYKKFGMWETDRKFSKENINYVIMEKSI